MVNEFCSCLAHFWESSEEHERSQKRGAGAARSVNMTRGDTGKGTEDAITPRVKHDLNMRGSQVRVKELANGRFLISGAGLTIASLPLEQDCSFWQVKVLQPGRFSMGVSRAAEASALEGMKEPLEWALRANSAETQSEREEDGESAMIVSRDGDVFSCVFDQSSCPMLRFFQNGKELEKQAINRVRGLVFPALELFGDGVELSFLFHESEWSYPPPSSRYMMILETRRMI